MILLTNNKLARYFFTQSYQLIVLRHGQSQWNKVKRWAGWTDIRLSPQGIIQSQQCAKILMNHHVQIDQAYTSVLTRTILSLNIILDEMNLHYIPVTKSWRLNEKNYGALQGENKYQMSVKYGQDKVKEWRRSLDIRPPSLQLSDLRHPRNDRRYRFITDQLPSSQCLMDVAERLKPLLFQDLFKKIKKGRKILVVTHGNVIRALFYILFKMSQKQLSKLNFPNAVPVTISFNSNLQPFEYHIIGDKQEIQRKMQQVQNQTKMQ